MDSLLIIFVLFAIFIVVGGYFDLFINIFHFSVSLMTLIPITHWLHELYFIEIFEGDFF